nr:uncharacterized protein LOC128705514 [Cherax quadricarinatus]
MKIPHKHCITFEDGVKYLYEKFLPTLKHSIYEIIETSENVSEAEKEAVVTDVNNSSYQCSKQQHDDNSSSQHIEEHDVDDPDDHCPRDDYSDADLGSCAEKQMTDDPKK